MKMFLLAFFGVLMGPLAFGSEKPNIVLILTDDQGYGDLGCTGNKYIKTPNIDALAAESSCLEDYHVAPTCSPTRAALLTGHWTNRTGVWHTINGRSMLRENEITIGQLLKDNGYETGMFGKWHLGDNYPYRPEDRGFDEVLRHGGGGVGQTPDVWDNAYFDGSYFRNGQIVPATGFCTDVFFEAGNAFIKKCAATKKPFLAYISLNAAHGPLHCPQKYLDMYPDQSTRVAAFYGMITNIDDNVAKTRTLLEELGIQDDTIFIFTTDNGTATGDQVYNAGMRGKKGSEYDGGHRVPFFLHWPAAGIDRQQIVKTLTHAVDIVPTLLDLTGSNKPEGLRFDGRSIRALLDPAADPDWPDRMLVTDSQRVRDPIKWRKSAVMSQQYRLVNGVELFDIQADPGQTIDIARRHSGQVAKMRAFYEAWWAELKPTFAQTTEIYLGQPQHESVILTGHDWIGNAGVPWNQHHIRSAYGSKPRKPGDGATKHVSHWAVKVVREGTYQICLLRWPAEARWPITAPLPAGPNVPGASQAFRTTPGLAVPVTQAVLRVDGQDLETQPVHNGDIQVTFTATLTAGSHRLAPVFKTSNGELGAYYAIVTIK